MSPVLRNSRKGALLPRGQGNAAESCARRDGARTRRAVRDARTCATHAAGLATRRRDASVTAQSGMT